MSAWLEIKGLRIWASAGGQGGPTFPGGGGGLIAYGNLWNLWFSICGSATPVPSSEFTENDKKKTVWSINLNDTAIARPWGYITVFMLNSTEHEISTAHKNWNTDK